MRPVEALKELQKMQQEAVIPKGLRIEISDTPVHVIRCPKSFKTDDFIEIDSTLE